ncbi:MAG: hypothetical protein FWD40_06395 [Treponema sp.]|nr:hypothetical protein [Treponema sp.]
MMKKICILTVLFFLVVPGLYFLSASEAGKVEFNIRFFDRRIYHVESDPILVQITITNNSPLPYRFKLADDRGFSVDFDIRTMSNRSLPFSDSLIRKRTQNVQVFFREVAIESGESFSFVEDLRDYISFGQSGSFRVRAKVYPELIRSSAVPAIESNFLNLNLRPALIYGEDGIPLEMDIATGAILVKQKIPPDEVVTYMLTARQESQWERFFLYLDTEAMLTRDPVQRRRYTAMNEDGRRRMLLEYRQNLQNATVDGDIFVIPTTFDILRTEYNNDRGTVIVLQRFRLPNYTELRQYTYDLEKRDNFWIIVNYSVQGMGTVAND